MVLVHHFVLPAPVRMPSDSSPFAIVNHTVKALTFFVLVPKIPSSA